jgi:hypothetical protein
MFVLALFAVFVASEPATPNVYKAYPSLSACMAMAQHEANAAQRDLDAHMGKGMATVYASCVEVKAAGNPV